MRFKLLPALLSLPTLLFAADPWHSPSTDQIDAVYPQISVLYEDLHRNPELSLHEEKTASRIADQLRKLGYDVTTHVGGTGVVGVLKNGSGPTVMIRAELDALPVPEKTELAYASRVTTHNDQGIEVPVMHACGHDLHMSVGMGTAALLAQNKDRWHGTFIYVGQPAEERIQGATAMLKKRRPVYTVSETGFCVCHSRHIVSTRGQSRLCDRLCHVKCRFGRCHDLRQRWPWFSTGVDCRSDCDRRPHDSELANHHLPRKKPAGARRYHRGHDSWRHQ